MSSEIESQADVQAWVDRIQPRLADVVENIVSAGAALNDAKEALAHGQFGQLLAALGLTRRTAQRFMAIARHPVLADATRVSHLPSAWSVLFELSRIDPDTLVGEIEAGTVSPQLTREEAQRLASDDSPDPVFSAVQAALTDLGNAVDALDKIDRTRRTGLNS